MCHVASIHRTLEVISQDRRLSKITSNKKRGDQSLREWIVKSPSVGRILVVRVWAWEQRWWLVAGYYDRRAGCGAKLQCTTELSASHLLCLVHVVQRPCSTVLIIMDVQACLWRWERLHQGIILSLGFLPISIIWGFWVGILKRHWQMWK